MIREALPFVGSVLGLVLFSFLWALIFTPNVERRIINAWGAWRKKPKMLFELTIYSVPPTDGRTCHADPRAAAQVAIGDCREDLDVIAARLNEFFAAGQLLYTAVVDPLKTLRAHCAPCPQPATSPDLSAQISRAARIAHDLNALADTLAGIQTQEDTATMTPNPGSNADAVKALGDALNQMDAATSRVAQSVTGVQTRTAALLQQIATLTAANLSADVSAQVNALLNQTTAEVSSLNAIATTLDATGKDPANPAPISPNLPPAADGTPTAPAADPGKATGDGSAANSAAQPQQ